MLDLLLVLVLQQQDYYQSCDDQPASVVTGLEDAGESAAVLLLAPILQIAVVGHLRLCWA